MNSHDACGVIIMASGESISDSLKVGGAFLVSHTIQTAAMLNHRDIVVITDREMSAAVLKTAQGHVSVRYMAADEDRYFDVLLKAVDAMPADIDNVVILCGDMPLIKRDMIVGMIDLLGGMLGSSASAIALNDASGHVLSGDQQPHDTVALVTHAKIIKTLISNSSYDENRSVMNNLVFSAINKGLGIYCVNTDKDSVARVTNSAELCIAEYGFQTMMRSKLLNNGVNMSAPETVFFGFENVLSEGVLIHPYVIFGPDVIVESGVEIMSFSTLRCCHIGAGVTVGPFAKISDAVYVDKEAIVGSFVEIKRSTLGQSSKVKHLSYIGDSTIGSFTNVGAGTVTCNYNIDRKKSRTTIGNKCFIGANTSIVAPLIVGDCAIVGAGSVITEDVPDSAMAIARAPQVNTPKRDVAPGDKVRKERVGKRVSTTQKPKVKKAPTSPR